MGPFPCPGGPVSRLVPQAGYWVRKGEAKGMKSKECRRRAAALIEGPVGVSSGRW